ncbi:hypothetical protein ELI48_02240 [Rhizobium ruizarguesonis]|uniref:hypothetical protein n=1 Tax=Rhizobium ruizarguesonis TaxID=2081791 RepID=UPI00102F3FAA|nr:hypothetical protein [Rhizobium ruizarguesonis]TAU25103.1 hypothetical protein ELI48_02240 [Rhizobium ruizarguesonis]TAU66745.1 hypothetical protein ELI45_02060 [Rhizobium ruizarguesonis]TAW08499.1 hypothetical protein ELI26_02230 [Rhizobium ruizarguesonis]
MSDVDNIAAGIVSIVRGAIGLAGTVVLLGCMIYNPITQSVLAGMKFELEFRQDEVKAIQAKNFRLLCDQYKDASFISKWTKTAYLDLHWCDEYLDRM